MNWPLNASTLIESMVSVSAARPQGGFRAGYMKLPRSCVPGPVIGAPESFPQNFVSLLMQKKKDSAIMVKYVRGDWITNMAGALHTLVVPAVPILLCGELNWSGHHFVARFESPNRNQLARPYILSALVQTDFENHDVLYELIKLGNEPIRGRQLPLNWAPKTPQELADTKTREECDKEFKAAAIYAVAGDRELPQSNDIASPIKSVAAVLDSLRSTPLSIASITPDQYIVQDNNSTLLSIGFLASILREQIHIELETLDSFNTNYCYTWDPPAIFAKTMDPDLLDELWAQSIVNAIRRRGPNCNLCSIAINDWRNDSLIPRVKELLAPLNLQAHRQVTVFRKASLTQALLELDAGCNENSCLLDPSLAIVLHNNSDAFGQNVESESEYGSLDGALGSSSTAAASLARQREDLLDKLIYVKRM